MHTTHTMTKKNAKARSTTKVLRLTQQTHRLLKRVAVHHETTMMACLEKLVLQEAAKVEKAYVRRLTREANHQPTAQVA